MRKLTLTAKERRFLIIWVSLCAFALLCNVAPIKGTIKKGQPGWPRSEKFEPATNLFASGNKEDMAEFWPLNANFVNKNEYYENGHSGFHYSLVDNSNGPSGFYGIFNGFDYLEFFVYSFLGLAIIFVPKIW